MKSSSKKKSVEKQKKAEPRSPADAFAEYRARGRSPAQIRALACAHGNKELQEIAEKAMEKLEKDVTEVAKPIERVEKPREEKTSRAKAEKRMGGLSAAAQILRTASAPMNCLEMMEAILKKQLWTTNGKTPHATIYAAIIREIAAKGKESRFKKVEAGRFAING